MNQRTSEEEKNAKEYQKFTLVSNEQEKETAKTFYSVNRQTPFQQKPSEEKFFVWIYLASKKPGKFLEENTNQFFLVFLRLFSHKQILAAKKMQISHVKTLIFLPLQKIYVLPDFEFTHKLVVLTRIANDKENGWVNLVPVILPSQSKYITKSKKLLVKIEKRLPVKIRWKLSSSTAGTPALLHGLDMKVTKKSELKMNWAKFAKVFF